MQSPDFDLDSLLVYSGISCRNCYQPIRESTALNSWDTTSHPNKQHLVSRKDTTEPAYIDGVQRACTHCGDIDSTRWNRPLNKYELLEAAANICRSLDALEIPHDHVELVAVADELKSTPELAGRDDTILEQAAEQAIKRQNP